MELKRYSVLAVAFLLPLAAGRFATGDALTGQAAASDVVAAAGVIGEEVKHDAEDQVCAGGGETSLEVVLDARDVVRDARGEVLGIDLDIESRLDKPARMVYSLELVDDRGRTMMAPKISKPEALEAKAGRTFDVPVPAGLKQGYYRVRASVAARTADPSERLLQHAELFLRVSSEGIIPISHEDFMLQSNANLAFRLEQ